jgi:hypothetical protein
MTTDTNNELTSNITRELVPERRRADFIDVLFGVNFPMQLEPYVFAVASELSADYRGGYWHLYSLGNGGFYMALDDDARFTVRCENGYHGAVSADALGITACMYAFSRLSFVVSEGVARVYAGPYHLLREYAMDHPEVAAIVGATD